MSISDLEALIDSKLPTFRKGDIVNGTILEIRQQVVLVDIGYKSEGVISISEFEDEEIEVGDQIEVLLESLEKFGLNEEDYKWYVDLRRFGGAKHAGFGLGFERLIMYVTGISNIRDVQSFPRTTGNADF